MRHVDDKAARHLGEVQWNDHWLTQDLLAIALRSRTSRNRQWTYTIAFGTGNIETRAEDGNGNAGRSYLSHSSGGDASVDRQSIKNSSKVRLYWKSKIYPSCRQSKPSYL